MTAEPMPATSRAAAWSIILAMSLVTVPGSVEASPPAPETTQAGGVVAMQGVATGDGGR